MQRCATLAALTVLLASACSLLVQFNPEGQPCSSVGECLTGYVCVDGGCVTGARPDAGAPCGLQSCTAGQRCAAGACVACAATETVCDDTQDNDCDLRTDCADPDCLTRACSDGNACTTGETCGQSGCTGGAGKTCTTPGTCQVTPGTCNPTSGACVYAPAGLNSFCTDSDNCTSGDHCDGDGGCVPVGTVKCTTPPSSCFSDAGVCNPTSGACTYPPLADGTSCGVAAALRCCTGNCVDISTNAQHCGGCGLSCGDAGYTCETVAATLACTNRPVQTSGRCSCNALSGNTCPAGQSCRGTAPANRCSPTTVAQCAPGESLVSESACPNFCRYPP